MNNISATCVRMNICVRRNNFVPRAMRVLGSAAAGQFRRTALLAGALALLAPLAAFAQTSTVSARVTDRVDLARLTTLAGNTHPLARVQYDQGAAPADLPMNRIMLVLKRSPELETALQSLLTEQQATSSPNFHKWLTPVQFGQQFGPSDADIQAVTSWLASYGFQSIQVSNGRTTIEFSGTAAQVEAGLHTSIHRYVVNGQSHWANASDPQIPAALAPVVAGFVSLHDFRKKPTMRMSNQKATATVTPGARPQINLQDSKGNTVHALVPGDFNKIYNVPPSATGSGVTIGIISNSNINVQDVADFRSMWGLSVNNPIVVLNGPDPGDVPMSPAEGEAILDATWSGAVAPAATVKLVASADTNAMAGTDLSEVYIINNNLSDIMTESFSGCERDFSGNSNFYLFEAEQAAAQGITYLVASGDGGPDSCDSPSTEPATATSVNILASTPYTVAVGGTQFNEGANSSTYWGASNDPTTGASAISYIPENVWNESCTVAQVGQAGCPASGLWSSGGGLSTVFTKPPWQVGVTGITTANVRSVPDVALTAADHDGYVVCIDLSCEGTSIGFGIASGTSASVQAFGGIMALLVQQTGARLGIANYALYKLAAAENYASCNGSATPALLPSGPCVFNDITVGNTNVPGPNNGTFAGFAAGPAYDETTGLGSVNATNLLNKWNTVVNEKSKTTLVLNNNTAVSFQHGMPVPVGITVAAVLPATGTPTGDVSLVANGVTVTSGQGADWFTLSAAGTVSSSVNSTIFLPGGTNYQVKAHYEGDANFMGSDSLPITVTITPESSSTAVGIVVNPQTCTTATTVVYGSSYYLSAGVIDTLGVVNVCLPQPHAATPSGTVTLSDKFNGATISTSLDAGTYTLNSFGYFEDLTIQLPAGTHIITAAYSGDISFKTSSSTDTVTVTQAPTTASVIASPTTVAAGQNVTLTATVATTSFATANSAQEPTGKVQFFVNGAPLNPQAVVSGGINGVSPFYAQATAQLSSTTLVSGQDKITAQYLGDSNYSASAVSPSVTVNVGGAGINVTPGCASSTITIATAGSSGSCLITVVGANGFSGAVALTCTISSAPSGAAYLPICSFGAPDSNFTAPGTITLAPGSETGTATFNVSTTAASRLFAPASRPHGPNWLLIAEIAAAMACMFLLLITLRERRGMVTLAAALFMVMAVATGCGTYGGGGGGGGGHNPGTTLGTYTITVTATPAGGTAQTAPITVIVN